MGLSCTAVPPAWPTTAGCLSRHVAMSRVPELIAVHPVVLPLPPVPVHVALADQLWCLPDQRLQSCHCPGPHQSSWDGSKQQAGTLALLLPSAAIYIWCGQYRSVVGDFFCSLGAGGGDWNKWMLSLLNGTLQFPLVLCARTLP
jgi:hypothetical protein